MTTVPTETTADEAVKKALTVVNWDAVTKVETASFGAALGMMRDAEVRLQVCDRLFNHRSVVTLGVVAWSMVSILTGTSTWLAVTVPSTAMLADMLWCRSRRVLIHSILLQYRDEVLLELSQLSKKYPLAA
jgi:hypothetical protein